IKSCQSLPPIDFGYVIDSDGPPGTIVNGAPYHYDFRAVIHGKAAHAGVAPERGINAIVVAAAVIQQIEFGRIGPDTTSNIGVIHGGKARNIVPDRVELTGEIRSFDEEKAQAQLSRIREVLTTTTSEYGAKFCFDVEKSYGGYRVLPDHPGVSIAKQAAERIGITPTIKQSGGGTDANILNELGITTVPLGIAAQGEHTKEEQIRVADLIKVAEHLTEIMILSAG
ncbi:MAG: M20/M25/M40 family metallo-hydrolase, partial [Limnochordia bacterium]|nr:M20/M25/M40 family metallo-hydrolase [Limnochordia bacterium]